jgi:hypothetical protein
VPPSILQMHLSWEGEFQLGTRVRVTQRSGQIWRPSMSGVRVRESTHTIELQVAKGGYGAKALERTLCPTKHIYQCAH